QARTSDRCLQRSVLSQNERGPWRPFGEGMFGLALGKCAQAPRPGWQAADASAGATTAPYISEALKRTCIGQTGCGSLAQRTEYAFVKMEIFLPIRCPRAGEILTSLVLSGKTERLSVSLPVTAVQGVAETRHQRKCWAADLGERHHVPAQLVA